MENTLSQRFKNIAVFLAIAVTILGYYFLNHRAQGNRDSIAHVIEQTITRVETYLAEKIDRYKKRGDVVFQRFQENTLQHAEMYPKEALVLENNGVVDDYYGEIFHFGYRNIPVGQWVLTEKNSDIYFTWRVSEHLFYVRHFCHLERIQVLLQMKFPFAIRELRYSKNPLTDFENINQYDDRTRTFFYSHLLTPSNRQLILTLKLYNDDIENYYLKKRDIFLFSALGFFLLLGIFQFYRKKPGTALVFWLLLLVALFFLVSLLGKHNLYLVIAGFSLVSIYQLLMVVLLVVSIFYFFRKRFKIRIISYLLFNITMVLAMWSTVPVYKSVDFNYTEFNLDYFVLMLVVFLLHLWPLLFVRGFAYDYYQRMTTTRQKVMNGLIFLVVQLAMVLNLTFAFEIPLLNLLALSSIAFIMLFFRRSFLSRVTIIFILAIGIFQLNSSHILEEKREFVESNLKNIFLNQSNYAQYIAREIIYEINANIAGSKFHTLFEGDVSERLESIWRKSLASRESVGSGIFVVSNNDQLLSHFSYQLPYLEVKSDFLIPFWAMQEATAEVSGKEIFLANAYISIFKGNQYLGRVVVQVLNSPELLLRYQEKNNIFYIYNKIDGRDFSYIKLNDQYQILENPSNINLENILGILQYDDKWISFKYMDLRFTGYIFRDRGHAIIIFFPVDTLLKEFSEVIKIFLFFCLFFLVFYARKTRKIDWRNMYYSFSIRVFLFLVLISILTAVVFSIFFVNFTTETSEQQLMQIVYENGRTAQNIGYDLIKKPENFSPDHLFSISTILNSDVTVYEKKGLLETSNLKNIIHARIPEYLHSRILMLLDTKHQKFVLDEDERSFRLFYKVYEYVFMLEYLYNWRKKISEKAYYTDFILTMFFILVIIGVATALFFRNKILAPIEGLHEGMAQVEKGELPILENIPAEIEIKTLYMGFNSMIEGIREQKKSISEIAQMKTIIRMGRRVAHEVKNPLTPIKLSAEQILLSLRDKNPNYEDLIKKSVNYIIDETEHLRKVSYGFLDLSRMDEVNAESFDLMRLVHEEIFSVQQLYGRIAFSVNAGENPVPIMVNLDKVKLKQVLKNLINNSIEAIGEKNGAIAVQVKKENQRVHMVVSDSGIGMDDTEIKQAFEADYSTKEVGTGLGLFIVKRIIDSHKGHVEIRSEKYNGTQVIIDLPEKV